MQLTISEKKVLLSAARNSIELAFRVGEAAQPDYKKFPELKSHAGAFVTLTEDGNLRGCIGYIESEDRLFDTVCHAAQQAAFHDPRFQPLDESELDTISIEISVLTPPFPLSSYEEIEIGKHGLILEDMDRRGLLLPQVPVEHHMNKEEFLTALCEKAGLPGSLWRSHQLKLLGFTALVFNEEEVKACA
jgi:AmmeMemoRadiSam system protein A